GGELVEPRQAFARLDLVDRREHRRFVAPDLVGPATLARAQTGGARFGSVGEEAHVAPRRMARGARRAAVDAGRQDAGDEAPVEPTVALQHRAPGFVVVDHASLL